MGQDEAMGLLPGKRSAPHSNKPTTGMSSDEEHWTWQQERCGGTGDIGFSKVGCPSACWLSGGCLQRLDSLPGCLKQSFWGV